MPVELLVVSLEQAHLLSCPAARSVAARIAWQNTMPFLHLFPAPARPDVDKSQDLPCHLCRAEFQGQATTREDRSVTGVVTMVKGRSHLSSYWASREATSDVMAVSDSPATEAEEAGTL